MVGVHLHAPVALPRMMAHGTLRTGGWVGTTARPIMWSRENFVPLSGAEPCVLSPATCRLVTLPTELFLFLIFYSYTLVLLVVLALTLLLLLYSLACSPLHYRCLKFPTEYISIYLAMQHHKLPVFVQFVNITTCK